MNNYSEIIDILAGGVDLRAVAIEVAKGQPSAFVSACNRLKAKGRQLNLGPVIQAPDWRIKATELVRAGEKIEAIKHCRNVVGMGLKEAKEAVEGLPV